MDRQNPVLSPVPPPQSTTHRQRISAHLDAARRARRHGDPTTAVAHLRAALELQPGHVSALNNLGNTLQSAGDLEAALECYTQAIEQAPEQAILHCNLAGLWQLQGDPERAITAYRYAIELQPALHLGHYNLAKILAAQGEFVAAEAAYRETLRHAPEHAEAHLELGQLYHGYGFMPRALHHYRASLRLKPSAQGYNALGAALQEWGNLRLARASYRRALRLDPNFEQRRHNLAQLHEALGDLQAARTDYERALEAAPDNVRLHYQLETIRRRQADWEDGAARRERLRAVTERYLTGETPGDEPPLLSALALDLPPDWYRALAERAARRLARQARALGTTFAPPSDPHPARLRIGYLSPDFRCHAVGTLVAGLFEHHHRPEFEIHAYALVPGRDVWTERIRAGCDHYTDLSRASSLAIAQRIHADGIHLLIDLAGYTSHARPLVLALRPAPIQIQYLGYPGTLGADFVPYLIADRHLIPPAHSAHYSEQVIRLPNAWACAPLEVGEPGEGRAECGLPQSGVVYCCHNAIHKIDPETFTLWMRILAQVPDSVLWLLDGERTGSNARLRATAAAAGIDPRRLVFAPKRPHAEYLARYRLADLFLDTPAYNAGATAVGALSAGLPVLTCPGTHYAARMGASLCHAVGLPELVCDTPADYVERAVALGRDPARLAALGRRLSAGRDAAPLFRPAEFVTALEETYRTLWHDYRLTATAPRTSP